MKRTHLHILSSISLIQVHLVRKLQLKPPVEFSEVSVIQLFRTSEMADNKLNCCDPNANLDPRKDREPRQSLS